MKKFTAVLLVLLISLVSIGCFSACSGGLDYYDKDGEISIRFYEDEATTSVLEIPDEIDGMPVVRVQDYGCFNTEALTKIIIGKNVREIGEWAFTNNQGLLEFVVSPDNQWFCSVDGVLYDKACETLIFYPAGRGRLTRTQPNRLSSTDQILDNFALNAGASRAAVSYTVLPTCKVIRTNAFYKCTYLEQVILPEGLTTIGVRAFFGATRLMSFAGEPITLVGQAGNSGAEEKYENVQTAPLPSTLVTLDKDAFSFCTALRMVTLPVGLQNVGEYVFYNSTAIQTVIVNKTHAETEGWGNKWWPTQTGTELAGCNIVYLD